MCREKAMTIDEILSIIQKEIKITSEKEYFLIHQVRYRHILTEVKNLHLPLNAKILDVGCFPYHIGKTLEMLGYEVFGIASFHEPIKNKNIKVLNIEKENFPFKDDFFDLVLFNEVIEHLPQSPIPALREIYRVIKKGSYLITMTPNIARSINRFKLLVGKNIMYPISVFFEELGQGNNIYHRHNREYTLQELSILPEKVGFNIVRKDYLISYTPFRERMVPDSSLLFLVKLVNYFLMLAVPSFRDTLIVIGKK